MVLLHLLVCVTYDGFTPPLSVCDLRWFSPLLWPKVTLLHLLVCVTYGDFSSPLWPSVILVNF